MNGIDASFEAKVRELTGDGCNRTRPTLFMKGLFTRLLRWRRQALAV